MGSESYHESPSSLRKETLDLHRALTSLREELEAIDWYQQRIDASEDDALKAILLHNRNEEIEHAAMLLEWLRRREPVFEKELRKYLFQTGDIARIEHADEEPDMK